MMPSMETDQAAAVSKNARNKKCLYCDRRFVKAEHLRRHQRSHTGEKPFQCKHCLKEYARSDVLMRHIRNHHLLVESEQDNSSKSSEKSTLPNEAFAPSGSSQNVAEVSGPAQTMPKQPVNPAYQAQAAFKHPGNQTPVESVTSVPHPTALRLDYAMNNAPDMRHSPQDLGRTNLLYAGMSRPVQKQVEIPTYPYLQTEPRMAPETFHSIHPWLDGYTQDFPSVPSNPSMWDDLPQLDFMGVTPGPSGLYPSPTASRAMQPSPPVDNISDERYAKIASLWPTRKRPVRRLIQTLWRDIANYETDNIYCEVDDESDETITTTEDPLRGESRWGFDNDCRARLINDCRPLNKAALDKANIDRRVSTDTRSDSGSSGQDVQSFGTKFPSTQILDISIDLYFRRFHPLMPFIHEPTFSAKKTSSTLLFPLCLFGLTLLDSTRAKKFVSAQIPDAIERCRKDLVLSSRREGQLGELLTAIASSTLLLALAAVNPQHGAAESTRLLYNETMAIADRHGLFVPQQGEELSGATFQTFPGNDAVWKAWARVESVKRLIVTLIMTDSFHSHLEGHSPRIHPEVLHFYFPCKTELFQATNGRRWSQLIASGAATIMPWLTPQWESTVLPPPSDASAIGFFGLFSLIWVRIGEARYRFNLASPENTVVLIPAEIFVNDAQAASIIPLILQVWQTYGESIGTINPNCEAFWHHLCLAVTADLGIFELAAGRGGADSAKNALEKIVTWSPSAAARRACVHAAQTFFIMSQRSVNSGTSFEAEISLVLSALVLGLYVFVMPQYDAPKPAQDIEAFELLDRVNWNLVGEEGFGKHPLPEAPMSCPARTWIREGGPITFSGVLLHGGYYSARRVLLDYVYLLEDVGKWNVTEFCHILRIMSDALIDLDPV